MLRNLISTAIVIAFTAFKIEAQTIEIIPQINYTFGGKIYAQFGELNIQDSESYGLSLNMVNDNVSFQLEYFYQPTTAEYRDYFRPEFSQNADLRISWYHIGVRQQFAKNENLVPFGGLSLGLTTFNLDSSPTSFDEAALSFGLQAGTNVYLSEKIGLRFHGRLLAPVQFNGFGFYAGTGGAGAAASAGSYFVQADFGAGLIIRLSKD
ncbi:MAG: porin family protein [Saprospiraceae bacterium]|nr:porin family protein [Saprospiraceae bacterium]